MNRFFTIICVLYIFKTEAQTSVLKIADSLYNHGNYSQAIKNYKQYNSLQEVSNKIAEAYQAIGNYDEALMYYKISASFKLENQLISYQYAKLLARTKKFQEASTLFYKLIDLDYKNPNYHYQLGLVLESIQDSTSQNRFYNAFQLDSTHQKAIYKLAKFQLQNKNYTQVEKYTRIGLNTYSNNAELISLQAQSYYKQEKYKKAIEKFNKLISLNETSVFIHEKLGYSYAKTFAFEKAIEHILIVLKMEPKNAENLFVLGQLYDRLGDFKAAEKYIKQAIAVLNVPLDNEFTNLAIVLNQQKKYKEAIKTLNQAIQENPKNSQAHFFMVMAKDKYYKDINVKLKAFQEFENKFPNSEYYSIIKQRISELKLEEFNKTRN